LPAIKVLLSKAPLPVSALGELAGPLLKSGLVAAWHASDGGVELDFAAPLVRQCLLMRILLAVPPDGVQPSPPESLSKSIEVALEGLDLNILQKTLSTDSSGKRISEVQLQELFVPVPIGDRYGRATVSLRSLDGEKDKTRNLTCCKRPPWKSTLGNRAGLRGSSASGTHRSLQEGLPEKV
jgi:hypothetical protein